MKKMLDVKGDKEQWVKVNCDPNMPFFSPQLYVDETYYDAICDYIDELENKNKRLKNIISQCCCEECGNELSEEWSYTEKYGLLCKDCKI